MRRATVGGLVLVLLFALAEHAAAEDYNATCISLRCFCEGFPGPETETSCDSSCEVACGGSSSSGSSQSGSARRFPRQRFSFGLLGGPGWTVVDRAGVESKGAFTGAMDVRGVAGGRPLLGVEMSLGLIATEVTAPHFGNQPEAIFFVPVLVGLTSSPRLFRAKKIETRLDLGADIGFMFRASCSTCDDDNLSTVALVYQLRAGIDTYIGKKKEGGFGVDVVFMLGKQGDTSDVTTPSQVEIRPPTFMIRLAILMRNMDLNW